MIILKRERFISNPGSAYRTTYECVPDRSGRNHFRVSGKVDIAEEINSYAGETDIEIISKMMAAGDYSRFRDPSEMIYGDFSYVPSVFEVQEAIRDAQEVFAGNKELVDKYGSFDDFVSAVMDNGFNLERSEPDKHEDDMGEK